MVQEEHKDGAVKRRSFLLNVIHVQLLHATPTVVYTSEKQLLSGSLGGKAKCGERYLLSWCVKQQSKTETNELPDSS